MEKKNMLVLILIGLTLLMAIMIIEWPEHEALEEEIHHNKQMGLIGGADGPTVVFTSYRAYEPRGINLLLAMLMNWFSTLLF